MASYGSHIQSEDMRKKLLTDSQLQAVAIEVCFHDALGADGMCKSVSGAECRLVGVGFGRPVDNIDLS